MLAWSDTATATIVFGVVVIVALILGRNMSGKLGNMQVTLGSIDKSVNHRHASEPTMSQDVASMREQMKTVVSGLAVVVARTAALETRLEAQERIDHLTETLTNPTPGD